MGERDDPPEAWQALHPEWTRTRYKQAEWNARRSLTAWLDRYAKQLGEREALGLAQQVLGDRLKRDR